MAIDYDLTLEGDLVRLEPLAHTHHDALVGAVEDGQMWDRWYTTVPKPDAIGAMIDTRLALKDAGSMIPFVTVRRSDEMVLGCTTFYDIKPEVPRVSIGYTWNRQSAHGSGSNAESKLLMMTYAFEVLDCVSVWFETSWSNKQSQAAIERLGARKDGVLRGSGRESNGAIRDTVMYSILAHEWPSSKATLEHRLARRQS